MKYDVRVVKRILLSPFKLTSLTSFGVKYSFDFFISKPRLCSII